MLIHCKVTQTRARREIEGFLAQQQTSCNRDPEPTLVFGRPVFRCPA